MFHNILFTYSRLTGDSIIGNEQGNVMSIYPVMLPTVPSTGFDNQYPCRSGLFHAYDIRGVDKASDAHSLHFSATIVPKLKATLLPFLIRE